MREGRAVVPVGLSLRRIAAIRQLSYTPPSSPPSPDVPLPQVVAGVVCVVASGKAVSDARPLA